MPQFENFDQYEATNPKSGKKKVIPIAPHSIQAVDYRPVKRKHAEKPERKIDPPFKDVKVEPVSIRQMEKEYRQAARSAPKPRKRNRTSLMGRIKAFFKNLFGGSDNDRQPKKQPGRSRQRGGRKGGQPKGQDRNQQGKPSSRNRNNRRNRGGRSRSSGKGEGSDKGPKESRQQSNSQAPKGDSQKKRPRRNRRRRPPGQSGQSGQGGPRADANSRNKKN